MIEEQGLFAGLSPPDVEKILAYANKLRWLREQGGYTYSSKSSNYYHYTYNGDGEMDFSTDDVYNDTIHDIIYMNKEQAKKWLDVLNKK